jgi:hypothetical protein
VTNALIPHIPDSVVMIWEPAAGNRKIAVELSAVGWGVMCSDIEPSDHVEKLDFMWPEPFATFDKFHNVADAIITNPPYDRAQGFCEQALRFMEQRRGVVAMLLRTDFDHAKSRSHLFRDCPAFAKKLVLTKRIAWFVEANGKPKASPSFNHAWYIWDWTHEGPPTIAYGP